MAFRSPIQFSPYEIRRAILFEFAIRVVVKVAVIRANPARSSDP